MEPQEPCGMNEFQAAKKLGVSFHTLRMWRRESRGPVYAKIGRRCIYMEDDLDFYIGQCRIGAEIGPSGWIKPATIVSYEDLGDGIISTIAAFRVNYPRPGDNSHVGRYEGQLAFRCPFCGLVHFHNVHHPGFGEDNAPFSADCPLSHRSLLNAHGYHLEEVADPEQAGSLPKRLVYAALKHLSRQRLAEFRKG